MSSASVFQRILVTGGAGFIGSHLVEALYQLEPYAEITVIDSFLTGSLQNITPWLGHSRFTLIEHDLTDFSWLQQFLQTAQSQPFTLVLHFASPASPPRYQAYPVLTYQVNSQVTHLLAEYCGQVGARMVFASTSEVYGDPLEHPQTESYWGNVNPNGIRSCYDEAKRMGETICGVHTREFGTDIRLVRIFNTYGPRMDIYDGRVIPDYCLRVLRQQPVAIFGNGQQTRSFCFVSDLVRGILELAQREGLSGETVNLGNSDEYTMNELADMLENVVGYAIDRQFFPLPQDDPQRRQPDVSKAERLLGWRPQVDLPTGLAQTFAFFRDRYEQSL